MLQGPNCQNENNLFMVTLTACSECGSGGGNTNVSGTANTSTTSSSTSTSTSSGGGSNSVIISTPVVPIKPRPDQIIANFVALLDQEQQQWWNNNLDSEAVINLSVFIVKNYPMTPENKDFVEQMINNSTNGVDVDFSKNIIYGINKPCQKDIIKNLMNSTSPFINNINQIFLTSDKVNIKFSNGSIPSANAATFPPYQSAKHTIEIRFDNGYLDSATNLSIATTTLHELVHAYLINLYLNGQLNSLGSDYNSLLNAFIAFYDKQVDDTYNTLDNELHNAMKDFISKMANALYNYSQSQNISVTPDYCHQLAWGSMYGTNLFQTVLTQQQQIDYGNTAAIEQDNLAGAKGNSCN